LALKAKCKERKKEEDDDEENKLMENYVEIVF